MIIKQLFIFIILNSFMVTALKSMEDDYKFDRPYIFYREQCNDVEVTLFNNKTKEEREADRTVDQAHKMEKELKELKNWRACLCSKREYFITQKEFKDLLDQDWFLKNSSLQGAFFDKEFLASIAGGGRLADLDTNSTLNCILSHAHIDKLNKERMVRAALFNNELENFNALLTFDPSLIKEANKYRPLYQVIRMNMLPLIDILLRHGVDIRAEPICLHRLVGHRHKSGRLYYLKQLLDAGADPNERWGGQTPLMIAGIKGRRSMARLLLEYGAEPRIKNDEGRTFLDLVADRPSMAQLVKLQKIP